MKILSEEYKRAKKKALEIHSIEMELFHMKELGASPEFIKRAEKMLKRIKEDYNELIS